MDAPTLLPIEGDKPANQIPSRVNPSFIAIEDALAARPGRWPDVANQAEMLGLAEATPGDVVYRVDLDKVFTLASEDPTELASWVEVGTVDLTDYATVTQLNSKANAQAVSDALAQKANAQATADALAQKANSADLTSGLASKTDLDPLRPKIRKSQIYARDSIAIAANKFVANAGAPTLASGVSGDLRPAAWALDPSTNEAIITVVDDIPAEWTHYNVTVFYTRDSGSGNVVFRLNHNSNIFSTGFDLNTFGNLELPHLATVGGVREVRAKVVATRVARRAGRPEVLRLVRVANDAADTFSGDILVLGVVLTPNDIPEPNTRNNIADWMYSWWTLPRAVVAGGKTYVGGVSQAGEVVLATLDNGGNVSRRQVIGALTRDDDHSGPSLLIPDDKPPIAFYNNHSTNDVIYFKKGVGNGVAGLESLDDTTGGWSTIPFVAADFKVAYQQVYRVGSTDEIWLFTRVQTTQWRLRRSLDWGTTWPTTSNQEVTLFDLGGTNQGYMTTAKVGNTLRVAMYGHPTLSDKPDIYYCEIDMISGDLKKIDGTVLANVKTGAGLPILDIATLSLAVDVDTPGGQGSRLFDVCTGTQPEIAFATWTSDSNAMYRYARWNGSSWVVRDVVAAGKSFGMEPATHYHGGMSFRHGSSTVGECIITAASGTTWTTRKYTTVDGGDTWVAGTILDTQNDAVVATPRRLARPMLLPPESTSDAAWLFVYHYGEHQDGYLDYASDLKATAK